MTGLMTRHAIVIVGLLACGACGSDSRRTPTAPGPVVTVQALRIAAPDIISVGHTAQVDAFARLSDGTEHPVPQSGIGWHTANPGVVTISPSGSVSAVHAGTATVWATYQGRTSDAVTITVTSLAPMPTEKIAAGEAIDALLTDNRASRLFGFTAPSDGLLVVQVTWNAAHGALRLSVDRLHFYDRSPIVGTLPVIRGRAYTITIADAAPWDNYGGLHLPFAVTVSMK